MLVFIRRWWGCCTHNVIELLRKLAQRCPQRGDIWGTPRKGESRRVSKSLEAVKQCCEKHTVSKRHDWPSQLGTCTTWPWQWLSPICLSGLICQTCTSAVLQRLFRGLNRTIPIRCMFWYSLPAKCLVKLCHYYCCCHYRNSRWVITHGNEGRLAWKSSPFLISPYAETAETEHRLLNSGGPVSLLPIQRGWKWKEKVPRAQATTSLPLSAMALEPSYVQSWARPPCSHDSPGWGWQGHFQKELEENFRDWPSPWFPCQFIVRVMKSLPFQFPEGKKGESDQR